MAWGPFGIFWLFGGPQHREVLVLDWDRCKAWNRSDPMEAKAFYDGLPSSRTTVFGLDWIWGHLMMKMAVALGCSDWGQRCKESRYILEIILMAMKSKFSRLLPVSYT